MRFKNKKMNRKVFLGFMFSACALFGLLSSAVQTQTSAKAQIVFTSNADIYVMDADGKNHRRLTDGLGSNTRPAWAPDGRQIAFASFRDGNSEIYVMESDGKNPRNLTRHIAFDSMPSWSPDAQKIAFVSDRDAPASSGHQNIYVMDADGKNVRRLTNYDRHRVYRPVWSPDGQRIAFALFGTGPGEPERTIFDIFVMDAVGKNLQKLTHDPRPDSWPAWSPDGQKIAFVSDRDRNMEIYVMDADGKNP